MGDRALKRLRIASLTASLPLGLGTEWLAFRPDSLDRSIADLIVGWVLIGSGLLAWERQPHSRYGPLIALSGGAWFLGNLGTTMLFLHRGPFVHALLSYPGGHLRGRLRRSVVAVAYAEATIQPLGGSPAATLALCALLAAAAVHGYVTEVGPQRRARAGATVGAIALALVLGVGSLGRLVGWNADAATLSAYEVALVIISLGLLGDLLRGRWSQGAVTGLVVDLGGLWERVGLRERLARAVGDTSLALGWWMGDERGYLDEAGRPVTIPDPGDARAVTRIDRDGAPVAVLVHDRAVLDDPTLVDAVAAATRIAVDTLRLDAEVRDHVAELEASRRRIIDAAGMERRRLERELRDGAEARLASVSRHVESMRPGIRDHRAHELLTNVEDQLAAARADLRELARGLHPETVTTRGLAAALAELTAPSQVSVEVHVDAGRWPVAIESAAYYVCSEALTNVTKYADASRVQIDVSDKGDRLAVTVVDDGIGGADPSRGSGLKGLEERVEALGGSLTVYSPPGGGTRLIVDLPTK